MKIENNHYLQYLRLNIKSGSPILVSSYYFLLLILCKNQVKISNRDTELGARLTTCPLVLSIQFLSRLINYINAKLFFLSFFKTNRHRGPESYVLPGNIIFGIFDLKKMTTRITNINI